MEAHSGWTDHRISRVDPNSGPDVSPVRGAGEVRDPEITRVERTALPPSVLASRYAAFAAAATAVNVATQHASSVLYTGPCELYAAIAAGTLTGLAVKYVLDRRWIFHDRPGSLRGHSLRFTLYSLTGVLTTAIFWGTELAFVAMGDAPWLRYVGAVLGLAAGYTLKYRLDRRFVFRTRAA